MPKDRNRSRSRDKSRRDRRHGSRERSGRHREYSRHSSSRKNGKESVKLFLNNLPSDITEKMLIDDIEEHVKVLDVRINRKGSSSGGQGLLGIVVVEDYERAERAMDYLNANSNWKVTMMKEEKERDNKEQYKYKDDNDVPIVSNTRTGYVKVREIWVGNLPSGISEKILYSHFFIFGEIESIELYQSKNFAFIRYKMISSASRAFDQGNGFIINGRPLKISFSDHTRRPDIAGDLPGYEPNEQNCKTLFIGFTVNSIVPSEDKLKEVFSKYGTVKAIYLKKTNQTFQRPHAFVDYSTHEEAVFARQKLYLEDAFGEKRRELNDANCEISYALKKKKDFHINIPHGVRPPFNMNMQGGMMNRYPHNGQPANMNGVYNPMALQNNNIPNSIPALIQQMLMKQNNPLIQQQQQLQPRLQPQPPLNMPPQHIQMQLKPQDAMTILQEQVLKQRMGIGQEASSSVFNQMLSQIQHQGINIPQNIPPPEMPHKKMEEIKHEKIEEDSVFDDDENHVWSGFITRSKKNRVGVDAYKVYGETDFLTTMEYNLNVSHRTVYEEVLKRPEKGVVIFIAQNELQEKPFNEYIDYFAKKERAGVVYLKNGLMYLIPPSDISKVFYETDKKHMLGVFIDPKDPMNNKDLQTLLAERQAEKKARDKKDSNLELDQDINLILKSDLTSLLPTESHQQHQRKQEQTNEQGNLLKQLAGLNQQDLQNLSALLSNNQLFSLLNNPK